MAAGLRAVHESADLIDVVLEVRDARVPRSSAVASLHRRLASKPIFVLLNRQDLAANSATRAWIERLGKEGLSAFAGTGTHAGTLRGLRAALIAYKGRRSRTRVAVVGAPNTGKSSVINALVHRKRTVVQDKAGVTRHVRWVTLGEGVDILDTPGVLEPRIESTTTAWQLAACGILPESAFDVEEVVAELGRWVSQRRPVMGSNIDVVGFARRRGMLRRGGELDRLNTARSVLSDFRKGHLGRITFELPTNSVGLVE